MSLQSAKSVTTHSLDQFLWKIPRWDFVIQILISNTATVSIGIIQFIIAVDVIFGIIILSGLGIMVAPVQMDVVVHVTILDGLLYMVGLSRL